MTSYTKQPHKTQMSKVQGMEWHVAETKPDATMAIQQCHSATVKTPGGGLVK